MLRHHVTRRPGIRVSRLPYHSHLYVNMDGPPSKVVKGGSRRTTPRRVKRSVPGNTMGRTRQGTSRRNGRNFTTYGAPFLHNKGRMLRGVGGGRTNRPTGLQRVGSLQHFEGWGRVRHPMRETRNRTTMGTNRRGVHLYPTFRVPGTTRTRTRRNGSRL